MKVFGFDDQSISCRFLLNKHNIFNCTCTWYVHQGEMSYRFVVNDRKYESSSWSVIGSGNAKDLVVGALKDTPEWNKAHEQAYKYFVNCGYIKDKNI